MKLKSRISESELKKRIFAYSTIIPVVLIFAYVRIIPIFKNFYYCLYNSTVVNPTAQFIGLDNFKELFNDMYFKIAIKNTFKFALWVTVWSVVFAVLLAAVLQKRGKMSAFYETIFFLPVITPMVPVSVVWKWIYDPGYGLLNYVLSWFKIPPVGWLVRPDIAITAIIIMTVWKTVGYNMLIFLVGIRDIPETYLEAARIDGASTWQSFWRIIIPLLKPILLYVLVITTINSFNVFSQIYVMTGGGQGASGNSVRTIVFDVYENAFRFYRTGYASAEAVLMFFMILILSIVELGLGKDRGNLPKRKRRVISAEGGRK